jgi:hypothetical protein
LADIDGKADMMQAPAFGYQGPTDDYDPLEPRVVPEDLYLDIGDSVKHKVFGVGKIVGIDGRTVAISFPGRGIKRLNLDFAPLERA